ncbi:MAG TPA: hypothetical protein PKB14_15090 [Rubrivivax sp.]|nr:hypothetical protein [Rubrivivax sp.]
MLRFGAEAAEPALLEDWPAAQLDRLRRRIVGREAERAIEADGALVADQHPPAAAGAAPQAHPLAAPRPQCAADAPRPAVRRHANSPQLDLRRRRACVAARTERGPAAHFAALPPCRATSNSGRPHATASRHIGSRCSTGNDARNCGDSRPRYAARQASAWIRATARTSAGVAPSICIG